MNSPAPATGTIPFTLYSEINILKPLIAAMCGPDRRVAEWEGEDG